MGQPDDDDLEREHRQMTQGQAPGGRTNRGPAVNAGGETEPQGLVPPYGDKDERADTTHGPDEVPADSAQPADTPPSTGKSPADEPGRDPAQ